MTSIFDEELNFGGSINEELDFEEPNDEEYGFGTPRHPPWWPWEQPKYIKNGSDFLREYICKKFLVELFDPTIQYILGYGNGYSLRREDGTLFDVRASCLTFNSRSWTCNFGNTAAEFILFVGLRNKIEPQLEFCLVIPRDKFNDRTKISITDDGGYHLKGFSEFSVDAATLDKMQQVVDAINKKDKMKIKSICPLLKDTQ